MTIEERLGRLERQNRWLKSGLGFMLLTVVAGSLLGLAAKNTVPDVVEAKAFHVVGDDGTVLVKLEGLNNRTGVVELMNHKGQPLAILSSTSDFRAGMIELRNGDGQDLVSLGKGTSENGLITTRNFKGHDLVMITSANDSGSGGITISNDDKQTLVVLGSSNHHDYGIVNIQNRKGQVVAQMTTTFDGRGSVAAYDPSGRQGTAVLAPQR